LFVKTVFSEKGEYFFAVDHTAHIQIMIINF